MQEQETQSDKFIFESDREKFIHNFKTELNNFLYQHVPGKLTISEFESLTSDVHNRVWQEWEKFV